MTSALPEDDEHYLEILNTEISIDFEGWNDVNGLVEHIKTALSHGDIQSKDAVSILLTDDDHIQHLNKNFRDIDKPTNVLSFPDDEDGYLGDIAVAYETLVREAIEQDKPFHHHFIHMLIHGVLHLKGYDHETDSEAEEMESLEVKILADIGIKNPYI
jgi:probable rRNA maturation factor